MADPSAAFSIATYVSTTAWTSVRESVAVAERTARTELTEEMFEALTPLTEMAMKSVCAGTVFEPL